MITLLFFVGLFAWLYKAGVGYFVLLLLWDSFIYDLK